MKQAAEAIPLRLVLPFAPAWNALDRAGFHRTGNVVQRWRNHAARATPFGPEIDHDRPGRLEHLSFEIGVRNLANGHRNTSFSSGENGLENRRRDHADQPMNEALRGQGSGHDEMMDASCASSAEAEISINSGVSVQSRAARIGKWG